MEVKVQAPHLGNPRIVTPIYTPDGGCSCLMLSRGGHSGFPCSFQWHCRAGGLSITGYGNGPDSSSLAPPQCGVKACVLLPVKGDSIFLCGLLWHHRVKDENLRLPLASLAITLVDVGRPCHSLGSLCLHSNFAGIAGQWDTILTWFLFLFIPWLLAVKEQLLPKSFLFC